MSEKKISDFFTSASAGKKRCLTSPEADNQYRRARKTSQVTKNLTDMDSEKIDMTHSQLKDLLSSLLDEKLVNIATKQDIEDVTSEVRNLKLENERLQEEMSQLKQQQNFLFNKINDLESRSKRNNLIFKGLQWNGQVDFKNLVADFCIQVLGCNEKIWVNRAHLLGNSRVVIAHFPSDSDMEEVMANTGRLRGTGYVVHRDYTVEVRKKRAVLTQVKNEIIRVCGRRRLPLVFDHLFVEGFKFTWEKDCLKAGNSDGAAKLLELFGKDFTAFINRLREGDKDIQQSRGASAVARDRGEAVPNKATGGNANTQRSTGTSKPRGPTVTQQTIDSYAKVVATKEADVINTQVPSSQG
jgi:hypothetical protein